LKGDFGMRMGLAVARLASAAWVGAAVLFVITAVREVRHPGFDSATKDTLALLRFPAYYAVGFALVSIALAGALVALRGRPQGQRRRIVAAACLLGLALAVMVADYLVVYLPMVGMITPVGRARVAEFLGYHRASMSINMVNVALCGIAAVLLCWQNPRHESLLATFPRESET
jgi:glucan phosphoethanolaminetransferase (alkaline phosphatase superfamily)